MDNLSSHTRKSLTDLYGADLGGEIWDCFTVHYTPTHGSWLNQAEIEIGLFARQCLGKRRNPDLKTLRRESRAWNRRMNRDRVKINWKFDRRAARHKFGYKTKSFKRSRRSGPYWAVSVRSGCRRHEPVHGAPSAPPPCATGPRREWICLRRCSDREIPGSLRRRAPIASHRTRWIRPAPLLRSISASTLRGYG